MGFRWFSPVLLALCAVACGAEEAEGGATEEPIVDGKVERGFEAAGLLQTNGLGFCSGVLIDRDIVLTAAHCVLDPSGDPVVPKAFYLGNGRVTRTSNVPSSLRKFTAKRAAAYGEILDIETDACPHETPDVALVQLADPVDDVEPAKIADLPELGTKCTVVGYGRHVSTTKDEGISRFRRRSATLTFEEIFPQAIRMKRVSGVSNSGDSGGPLFCNGTVVGVVSCGTVDPEVETDDPAALDDYYARVWTVKSRIQSHITRWHNADNK